MVILSRLYMLRNQLLHGGATWQSKVNREQTKDGVNFLSKFIPVLLAIMIESKNTLWGDASFPVVE